MVSSFQSNENVHEHAPNAPIKGIGDDQKSLFHGLDASDPFAWVALLADEMHDGPVHQQPQQRTRHEIANSGRDSSGAGGWTWCYSVGWLEGSVRSTLPDTASG